MEILIGLVVATVVVIGWCYGSMLVAVFLTLADLLGLTVIGLFLNPSLQLFAVISVAVIWSPVIICRLWLVVRPVHQFIDPPVEHFARDKRLTLVYQERPGNW